MSKYTDEIGKVKLSNESKLQLKDDLTQKARKKKRVRVVKGTSIAVTACLLIIAAKFIPLALIPAAPSLDGGDSPEEPPVISSEMVMGDMGGGGIIVKGIEDLYDNNPWVLAYEDDPKSVEFATLPVYKAVPFVMDYDERQQRISYLTSTGLIFGEDFTTSNEYLGWTPQANIEGSIVTDSALSALAPNNVDDKLTALTDVFRDFIDMVEPINSISTDYSFDGIDTGFYHIYDGNGTLMDRIISYNFNYAQIYFDENGAPEMIRKHFSDTSNVYGEYPIITVERAKEFLKTGRYLTNSEENEDFLLETAYIDLIYMVNRVKGSEEYLYIPYYRFQCELVEQKDTPEGFKEYASYYVPAIYPGYINQINSTGSMLFN